MLSDADIELMKLKDKFTINCTMCIHKNNIMANCSKCKYFKDKNEILRRAKK
jgi:hypothetical protein